jgi:hypothetical protein
MEDENIKVMPEGYNQYDLNFKIILVGDSGKRKIKKFIKKFI